MPSRFLQAIGVDIRSDEEREARGRAVRTSRHSSRVTSSRHRSTKLRTKERNKNSRSLMSATTGSESERRSRKKSSIRSNSGKKRSPKRREETEAGRVARRRERKDEMRRERDDSTVGETGVVWEDGEPAPSVADEEPTSPGLGITTLCDIPQQQAVDVFQFQSDWSDDEDAGQQPSAKVEEHDDHPAEYEDATDGHETDDHQHEEHPKDEHQLQDVHSDAEHQSQSLNNELVIPNAEEPSSEPQHTSPPRRSLAPSVVDETDDVPTPMPQDFTFSPNRTVSSGSSFISTQFSEPHDDAETERSTSPETSFKSPSPIHASHQEHETPTHPGRGEDDAPQSPSAAKLAAQTLAAEHRQKTIRRRSSHHSRRPEMPRHYPSQPHLPYQNPWIAGQPPHPNAQALSPIPPYNPGRQAMAPPVQQQQHLSGRIPLDAAGNAPPLTGYAALATALSPLPSSSPHPANAIFQPSSTLPALYRRFSTLNHRLLLHLQDELAELEEELAYLDSLDTASRTHPSSAPGRLVIRPASRREGAMRGSELDWRRGEVMGRISAKLHLYNETLASFQRTESLGRAREEDVEVYQEYLATKRPLTDSESTFLDHTEDLVSLAPPKRPNPPTHNAEEEEHRSLKMRARPLRRLTASAHSDIHTHASTTLRTQHQQALLLAALASVLLPLLTFSVIPNFVGRVVVALIIALGLLAVLAQNGATEVLRLGRREKRVVAGVWGGGMVMLALIA